MGTFVRGAAAGAIYLLISACGQQNAPAPPPVVAQAPNHVEIDRLKSENSKLTEEVATLRRQVEELSLTPVELFEQLAKALSENNKADALQASEKLKLRFPDSSQAKAANKAIENYNAIMAAREAQAKLLEARGFYALKTQSTATKDDISLRIESLQLGDRWVFDAYDASHFYRTAERGERYVLMRAQVQSTDKNPSLPDVGVYSIDGNRMTLLATMRYEFRRWSSHGTYIGLYHDFKNDFAHTPSVPFNAAAAISVEDAKKPFAVVATGNLCHVQKSRSGFPNAYYSRDYDCKTKTELQTDDFVNGEYRLLAIYNRPKGA